MGCINAEFYSILRQPIFCTIMLLKWEIVDKLSTYANVAK